MRIWAIAFLTSSLALSCQKPTTEPEPKQLDMAPPASVNKTNAQKVLMHYMPWYQSPNVDGYWGQHWTMNTADPTIISNGRRQIASHFYPLIGPYSSSDTLVLQWQSLLMKYAGVDGIIIDWYGTSGVHDYGILADASEVIAHQFASTGLEFSYMYEDRTVEQVQINLPNAGSVSSILVTDFSHLLAQSTHPKHTRLGNQPLLTLFGPEYVHSAATWDSAFTTANYHPAFFSLHYTSSSIGADGEFVWPWGGNTTSHTQHLTQFYNYATTTQKIAGAYPGFQDYYAMGGWGTGLGWTIPHDSTHTLHTTLQLAKQSNLDLVQLITWNDYGEGTMMEPTTEFGHSFLHEIKSFTGASTPPGSIELCTRWFQESTRALDSSQSEQTKKFIRQAYIYLRALQPANADSVLAIF